MKKFKNLLGNGYANAEHSAKLLFRAALLQAEKRDGIDYMKRFQDTWQYAGAIGAIPTAITDAYKEHIVPGQTTINSGLQTLKMA